MSSAPTSSSPCFLDSSALVKRYLVEIGSGRVLQLTAPDSERLVAVAHIGLVEVAAAFANKLRSGFITDDIYDRVLSDLINDAASQYSLVEMGQALIDRAIGLTRRHGLRGYDAVQLASALTVNPILTSAGFSTMLFVSADKNLLAAASAEGLPVENPNDYP